MGRPGRTQKPRGESLRAPAPAPSSASSLDSIRQHALQVDREAFAPHTSPDLKELERRFDLCRGAQYVEQLEMRIAAAHALHSLLCTSHPLQDDPAAVGLL